jgi:hypothetical protein
MGDVFSALAWNSKLEWWSGAADVAPDRRINLHVEAANDPKSLQSAIIHSLPAWEWLKSSESAVRAAVADQLTDARNEFCDPADEVTPDQFADRMKLLSARFQTAGSVELVYSDGMLLGGHWIIVPIGPDRTIGEAFEAG